jgi:hypothetical protein
MRIRKDRMFRKNSKVKQLGLFTNLSNLLQGKSLDIFKDKDMWHNVFREQTFNRIDESTLSCLYNESEGAPNYPINILIGMMILKEGFGWSDSVLFDSCRFNVLVRGALGMFDFSEVAPSNASYYNLKSRINDYDSMHSDDLMSKVFANITSGQVITFKVNGQAVRMDSKLLGSNIARVSRFELVLSVIKKFYKMLPDDKKSILPDGLGTKLQEMLSEDGEKTVYRSKDTELADRLIDMGGVLYQLVNLYQGQNIEYYDTIKTVLGQQFNISEEKVSLKPREELKASNIQSAEDTVCDYRKKGGQEIFGGYSANITETCDKGEEKEDGKKEAKLNLITAPEVKPATAADNEFYQSGILKTQAVTKHEVEESYTDGAYHSQDNKKFNQKEDIEMILTGLQGKEGRLSFEYQGDILIAIDKKTGMPIEISLTPNGESYKVILEGKPRYIKLKEIENYFFRKEIESIPQEKRNRRNNVEAAMFQISFFTRNNKIRYRGLKKTKNWLYMRCLWINMIRIKNYLIEVCPKSNQNGTKGHIFIPKIDIWIIFRNSIKTLNFYLKFNPLRIEWIFRTGVILKLNHISDSPGPIYIT